MISQHKSRLLSSTSIHPSSASTISICLALAVGLLVRLLATTLKALQLLQPSPKLLNAGPVFPFKLVLEATVLARLSTKNASLVVLAGILDNQDVLVKLLVIELC